MSSGARLEKLTIDNFAGIKHLEMDVSPFTVLIGPQSVGKSITAKVLYFLRSLPWILSSAAERDNVVGCDDAVIEAFAEMFSHQISAKKAASLKWSGATQTEIQVTIGVQGRISVTVPGAVRNAYDLLVSQPSPIVAPDDLGKEVYLADQGRLKAEQAFWRNIEEVMPEAANGMSFIPAGRSFYSQVQRDAASFFRSAEFDPLLSRFGTFLARLKERSPLILGIFKTEIGAKVANELLGGIYLRQGNEDFIVSPDGLRLPSSAWSSGQQEAYPLAFTLLHYCAGVFSQGLFIEEPEAHLFPVSQRIMTEFIALAFNARQPQMRVFLTTHSPYILTTLNNLLQAGLLYTDTLSEEKRKRLSEIVPQDRALPPGSVDVFYMDRDSCRSIMDEETGLIGTSDIDQASWDLSEQFDALLETQPS